MDRQLAPFYNVKTNTVVFADVHHPTITVENSTYSSAQTCGVINSAIDPIRFTQKLDDAKTSILIDVCRTIINSGIMVDYTKAYMVQSLRARIEGIWG